MGDGRRLGRPDREGVFAGAGRGEVGLTPDGVNQRVVGDWPGGTPSVDVDDPGVGIDLDGRADHESGAVVEHPGQRERGGGAGTGDHLVEANALDEVWPRVDDGDGEGRGVAASTGADDPVGGDSAGVARAEDDDAVGAGCWTTGRRIGLS